MSIPFAIALYFVIWWTVLFAVLPFGVRTQDEAGEIVPGTPESAPAHIRLLRIVLINTAVAAVVFLFVVSLFYFRVIDIDEMLSRGLGS
jgi:predicted secreted protein